MRRKKIRCEAFIQNFFFLFWIVERRVTAILTVQWLRSQSTKFLECDSSRRGTGSNYCHLHWSRSQRRNIATLPVTREKEKKTRIEKRNKFIIDSSKWWEFFFLLFFKRIHFTLVRHWLVRNCEVQQMHAMNYEWFDVRCGAIETHNFVWWKLQFEFWHMLMLNEIFAVDCISTFRIQIATFTTLTINNKY